MSEAVRTIGINWSPNSDIEDGSYQVSILFLCEDAETDAKLHELLEEKLSLFTPDDGHDGIQLKWDTKIRNQTFMHEFDDYTRLTEWDYLSNLGDVAESEN